MAAVPIPKKMENTTICRISLLAMASTTLCGKTWVIKVLKEREDGFNGLDFVILRNGKVQVMTQSDNIHDDQAQDQGKQGGPDKPGQGFSANPANRPDIPQFGNTGDQGGKNQGRNDHFDQP